MFASIRDWLDMCVCVWKHVILACITFKEKNPRRFAVFTTRALLALHDVRMKHAPLVAPMHPCVPCEERATCTCGLGVPATFCPKDFNFVQCGDPMTQMLHAWKIYLHLVDFWGKCG